MKKTFFPIFILLFCSISVLGADGDVFYVDHNGLRMGFTVIDESKKTCMVGVKISHSIGEYEGEEWGEGIMEDNENEVEYEYQPAIDESYTGTVTIPRGIKDYYIIEIGPYAFRDCKLNSLTFDPNHIQCIREYAFWGCTNLEIVSGVGHVKEIGKYAFAECTSYGKWFVQTFGELKIINEGTFYGCTSLQGAVFTDKLVTIEAGAFYGCSSIQTMTFSDSVTSIGYGAFYACQSLRTLHLPKALHSMGGFAFAHCSGLSSVAVPQGVAQIPGGAFWGCTSLSDVSLPAELEAIGYDAFKGCTSLNTISLPDGLSEIGYGAFDGCIALESIYIPANVIVIEGNPFKYCDALMEMRVDESNLVYDSRGDSQCIIKSCDNELVASCLSTVIPSDVKSIGVSAFEGNMGLYYLSIPSNVTLIKPFAFYDSSLWKVKMGNNMRCIGYDAFGNCADLEEVVTNSSLVYIGDFAFENCTLLSNVDISDHVEYIGDGAFSSCIYLPEISLPKRIAYIGYGAFDNCQELLNFTSYLTYPIPLDFGEFVFFPCIDEATLYVPKGCKSHYEFAKGWRDFGTIKEMNKAQYDFGDVNHDHTTDISDVLMTVDHILGKAPKSFEKLEADINNDDIVDISDVLFEVDIILGREKDEKDLENEGVIYDYRYPGYHDYEDYFSIPNILPPTETPPGDLKEIIIINIKEDRDPHIWNWRFR